MTPWTRTLEMTPYLVAFGLFLLGLLCIAVEVFVIPGFGFVGILGGLILVGDVVYTWLTVGPLAGGIVLILSVASTAAGVWIMMYTRVGKKFRHQTNLGGAASAVSVGREDLVDREGVADTHLRPAGVALVGDDLARVGPLRGPQVEGAHRAADLLRHPLLAGALGQTAVGQGQEEAQGEQRGEDRGGGQPRAQVEPFQHGVPSGLAARGAAACIDSNTLK